MSVHGCIRRVCKCGRTRCSICHPICQCGFGTQTYEDSSLRARDTLAAQLIETREKLSKVEALCIAWGIDYDDPATRLQAWADQQQATAYSLLTENTSLCEQLAEAQQEIARLKRG